MNARVIAPRYVRTSERTDRRLSAQNRHISALFEMCNDALVELMARGVTVLSVFIEGAQPAIEILHDAQARALLAITAPIPGSGGADRRWRHHAIVKNCRVYWDSMREDSSL